MRKPFIAVLFSIAACEGSATPPPEPAACSEDRRLGDVCVGVPSQPLALPSCAHTASDDAELGAALAAAGSGECVLLRPGTYAAVSLPPGVSLVGERADAVTVAAITASGGDVAIQNLSVSGGAVTVSAGNASLAAVRIHNSAANGVVVAAGASASLSQSEVVGAGRHGVEATGAASVTLDKTIISGGLGPGIWLECEGGCDCDETASGTLRDTILRGNRLVSASFVGAEVLLENVVIDDTQLRGFDPGFGMSLTACSDVTAADLVVTNSTNVGILVDNASAHLERCTVSDNMRGLWIQGILAAQTVFVTGCTIENNLAIGIGIDRQSMGVTVGDSSVIGTKLADLPGKDGGPTVTVADGINWLDNSMVNLERVTVSGSERMGVLIDGPATGSIEDLTLTTADGAGGIVQQNLTGGDESPDTSGTTPPLDTDEGERVPVPTGVIPPSI
jgi:hypothetical protein